MSLPFVSIAANERWRANASREDQLEQALRGAIAGLVGSDPVPPSEGEIAEWRALLSNHCACNQFCGDCDEDGPGTCKCLPRAPTPSDVEIITVRRR